MTQTEMKPAKERMARQIAASIVANLDAGALDFNAAQVAIGNPKLLASSVAQLINNSCQLNFVGMPVFDLDAPEIPAGWELLPEAEQIQSRMKGKWAYDPSKLHDHLEPGQSETLTGDNLRPLLEGKLVQRAALAQKLYTNQHLIPESWKDGKTRVFWGDIFHCLGGSCAVMALIWEEGKWVLGWLWLEGEFDADGPAVCVNQP